MVTGNDGFLPLFLLFEVDNAIGDGEILAESPCVACAEAGGNGGMEVLCDVERCEVWHGLEELRRAPSVEGAEKVLLRAKDSEQLEFVIGVA